MVAALGIAASLLSDVGFKALKSLTSNKSGASTTQAGITDQSTSTGKNVPANGFGSGTPDIGKLFSKIDADGDGKISKDEFLAFKQQLDSTLSALLKTQEQSSTTNGAAKSASLADQLFTKLDANNDGTLSKDELQSMLSHRHHHQAAANPSDQANAAAGTGGSTAGDTGGDTSQSSFLSALLDLQSASSSSS